MTGYVYPVSLCTFVCLWDMCLALLPVEPAKEKTVTMYPWPAWPETLGPMALGWTLAALQEWS